MSGLSAVDFGLMSWGLVCLGDWVWIEKSGGRNKIVCTQLCDPPRPLFFRASVTILAFARSSLVVRRARDNLGAGWYGRE